MNTTQNKKIVVTGGAGFIGTHLVKALIERGYTVSIIDSLVTGKRENIPGGVELIVADVRDRSALEKMLAGADGVVHLAAQISVPKSIEDPEYTHAVNEGGARNVFELAHEAKVKRLVYASSAAVYGDDPDMPKREESPKKPQSPYAESKLANEADAARLARIGLSSIGLRFFNVYGPGQIAGKGYASVIPRFIENAKANKPLPLTADPLSTRDFVHVRDVAQAIIKALESDVVGVFNIASGIEISLQELIDTIHSVVPVEVLQLPLRPGDIFRSVADVSRARSMLGWIATISFKEGIAELLV